jgi:hypothetical protein
MPKPRAKKRGALSIRELVTIVGREPVDIGLKNRWVVCVFEPEGGGAVIRVLLPK